MRSRIDAQKIIVTPEERVRLLRLGKELKHHVKELISIVQYRTYQRWLKELDEGKKPKRAGRPQKIKMNVRKLIVRIAKENCNWGYLRIAGELLKLRCKVSKSSVRRILREEGIHVEPKPWRLKRKDFQPWRHFINLHVNTLVACDFLCKNIWGFQKPNKINHWLPFGKRPAFMLTFIHLGTRKAWVSPATYYPNEVWVKQQAKNFLMWLEDVGLESTHLIRDRDAKFARSFDYLLKTSGIKAIRTPVRAPDANAFAESFIGTLRKECLNHFTCFSLSHLNHITQTYIGFYNDHRPHQGKGNQLLKFSDEPLQFPVTDNELPTIGKIGCKQQLGGLLKHYYRIAA